MTGLSSFLKTKKIKLLMKDSKWKAHQWVCCFLSWIMEAKSIKFSTTQIYVKLLSKLLKWLTEVRKLMVVFWKGCQRDKWRYRKNWRQKMWLWTIRRCWCFWSSDKWWKIGSRKISWSRICHNSWLIWRLLRLQLYSLHYCNLYTWFNKLKKEI